MSRQFSLTFIRTARGVLDESDQKYTNVSCMDNATVLARETQIGAASIEEVCKVWLWVALFQGKFI